MEKVLYSKGIFELVETEEEFIIDSTTKTIKRLITRRPPGIRAIIINKITKEILLSREFRYELNSWDYRLPGGKVFDSIEDFHDSLKKDNIDNYASKTVIKEVLEEVGLDIKNPRLIKKSPAGSSIVWDLYYYEVTDYAKNKTGPKLEENEIINGYNWYSFKEILELCRENKIHEDRTVGVLLTYILNFS